MLDTLDDVFWMLPSWIDQDAFAGRRQPVLKTLLRILRSRNMMRSTVTVYCVYDLLLNARLLPIRILDIPATSSSESRCPPSPQPPSGRGRVGPPEGGPTAAAQDPPDYTPARVRASSALKILSGKGRLFGDSENYWWPPERARTLRAGAAGDFSGAGRGPRAGGCRGRIHRRRHRRLRHLIPRGPSAGGSRGGYHDHIGGHDSRHVGSFGNRGGGSRTQAAASAVTEAVTEAVTAAVAAVITPVQSSPPHGIPLLQLHPPPRSSAPRLPNARPRACVRG